LLAVFIVEGGGLSSGGFEALKVHGADLEGVEHQGCGLRGQSAGFEAADDAHEGELEAEGVLEDGQRGGSGGGAQGADVEAAERLVLERGLAAAGAVELDVSATRGSMGVAEARRQFGPRGRELGVSGWIPIG
jgi:hypothetical protein